MNIFEFHKNKKYNPQYDFFSYTSYRFQRIFVGSLIFRGRKQWAFKFFIDLKHELKKREKVNPILTFVVSMMSIAPSVLLYKLRLGGSFHGVPMYSGERKKYTFSTKWVIKLLRDSQKRVTLKNVAEVLINSVYKTGVSIEKQQSTYKMGDLNRYLIRKFR